LAAAANAALTLAKARKAKIKIGKNIERCKLMDEIYKETCRPKMINPIFMIDHPAEMAILSKPKADDPKKSDRFQLIAGGIELVNGFAELNDPIEQEKRFKEAKIGTERKDTDFLEALQYID